MSDNNATSLTVDWTKNGIDDSQLAENQIAVKDLMLFISLRCNLRCKICYLGNDWLSHGASFSLEEVKAIIDHFGKKGLDRLTFLGGEPLLYPYITDIILYANQYPIKEKRITTNALDLSNLDFSRLKGSDLNHITVSFDGITPETHEYIRGPNTFNRAIDNTKKLIDHGFQVNATFTVNNLNKSQFLDTIHFFSKLGIKEVNYHLLSIIGNATRYPDLSVEPKEWVRLRQEMERLPSIHHISARIPLMYVTKAEYEKLVAENKYYAFQKKSYHSESGQRIIMYPNGKVYMSCDLTGTDFNFATFKNGIFKVQAGENELNFIRSQPDHPDPSTSLLGLDTQGFIRLSISYKENLSL
ncbi:MAG TPA: radical SAM protein [Patescibacteria group bacterium]